MLNYSDSIEKVNQITTDFLKKLQNTGVNNDRAIQFTMSLLCKAKGECGVLTRIEEELSYYSITKEVINSYVQKIQNVCGSKAKYILPASAERLIQDYYSNSRWGEYIQSSELTGLVLSLIKENGYKSIYNPFAGLASYGIADFIHEYHGQEINHTICNLARMRLELNNLDYDNFKEENSVTEWNTWGADCIVSTPPFACKIDIWDHYDFISKTTEDYVLERFIISRSKHAYYVMPSGVCFNQHATISKFRKQIVDFNMLDMVINLPSGIYSGSGISTSLLVLNKERKDKEPILFVDAKECFKLGDRKEKILDVERVLGLVHSPQMDCCAEASNVDIKKKKYVWSVEYYLKKELTSVPEGYDVKKLKEILKPIRGQRSFTDKRGRLARISDLSSDYSKYIRNAGDFDESDKLANTIKVEESVLLLSSIRELKPTFCLASPEEPVFVHPNLYAYKIDFQGISPEYLCLELSKKKLPFLGVTIPRVSREDLLDAQIAFPSLSEQLHIYQEVAETSKIGKAKELGLQDVIEKMKSEYMIEVRNRKHDMKTPMVQLRYTLKLMAYLSETLPEDASEKLNEYIKRQQVALDLLSGIVRHLADEDVFAEEEVVNIDEILSDFVVKEDNYKIDYIIDSVALNEANVSKPLLKIGRSDFTRMVNNIVSNAIEHGFVEKDVNYQLNIILSIEGDSFIIRFRNNGRPLPKELDKKRFGMRGVKGKDSKGSGLGGHIIRSIVEHYGGDYDLFTSEIAGVVYTEVVIKLPIYQAYE